MTRRLSPGPFGPPDHTVENFVVHTDCRHYDGGYPCIHWRPCLNCPHYDPVGSRVLIVMLQALGDMLILSPLPARIKRDDPSAHITWLVDESTAPVVRMNPYVDRVLVFGWEAAVQLRSESFDLVIGFERRASAAALLEQVRAKRKVGSIHGTKDNALHPLDGPSRRIVMMDVWNDYRTRWNDRTWTELYFDVAGYRYEGEPYVVDIPPAADRRVRELVATAHDGRRACLNMGGSFVQKIWPDRHWVELGRLLLARGLQVVLTGGAAEREHCEAVLRALTGEVSEAGRVVYEPLAIEEFVALPRYCDVVVTGDSFGFHTALAHRRPTVVLFGPSNPVEVVPRDAEGYVRALRSTFACSPCAYQMVCGGEGGCMDTISPDEVVLRVEELLAASATGAERA